VDTAVTALAQSARVVVVAVPICDVVSGYVKVRTTVSEMKKVD
jgi:hypothetical protein